jgi:hypothetical protein
LQKYGRFAAELLDPTDRFERSGFAVVVMDGHLRAAPRKLDRNALADARSRAGHKRRFAGQLSVRRPFRLRIWPC